MNRTCDHCHRELRSDGPYFSYCSDSCRSLYQDRLTRAFVPAHERRRAETPQQGSPGVAAVLADRAAGSRNTISVSSAWSALGNQAGTYDPYHDRYVPSRGAL